MTIKVWIYIIVEWGVNHYYCAMNDDDTVSVADIDDNGKGIKVVMRHYLLPDWCLKNGYECRVVVKEIEI